MPSSMIHLMVAYEYASTSPPEFWVGNIAPDSIFDWQVKDKFHFRKVENREQALRGFTEIINCNDLFAEGMLLHLFTDWKWDQDLLQQHVQYNNVENWYQLYRSEMGLLSARMYHDNPWSCKVWSEMLDCDIAKYNKTDYISNEDISQLLERANRYHLANPLAKPLFYNLEQINSFVSSVVREYRLFFTSKIF